MDLWQKHCELIDALEREANEWRKMAKRQKRLVNSYKEKRRYPKRNNRLPERRDTERAA